MRSEIDHPTPESESEVITEEGREGKNFRRKMFLHVTLCFSMFNIGWCNGMKGPAFEDLMMIAGVSSGKGSVFVSVNFAGMLVGSVLCGLVIDRYNKALVMACASFCFGCSTFLFPLCSLYWTMVLINGIQGLGFGVLLTGCFTICGQLWVSNAAARASMHSMHLCMPVGAILSPLVIAPFLSTDPIQENSTNSTRPIATMNANFVSHSATNDNSSIGSILSFEEHIQTESFTFLNQTINSTRYVQATVYNDQRLIIPFSLTGAVIFAATILFLVIFFQNTCLDAKEKIHHKLKLNTAEETQSLSVVARGLRLYLIGQLAFLDKGTEYVFIQFFPVFLHSKMGWNKILSSDIMSVHWGPFAFGRLTGILLSHHVKSSTFLFFDIILLIISWTVLLVGMHAHFDSLMWVSSASAGIALSTFSPCLVSWIHSEILSTSGKHTSFFIITCCLGSALLPLLIGNLVELDYIWFVYVLLIASLILLVNHICLFLFARFKLRPHRTVDSIIVVSNGREEAKMME